jgi:hypothetical protein
MFLLAVGCNACGSSGLPRRTPNPRTATRTSPAPRPCDHRFSISDAIMILVIGIVVTTVAREKLAARRARQRPKR